MTGSTDGSPNVATSETRSRPGTPDTVFPSVSVIVPVYRDAERLRLCLDALAKQTYPQDRTQIVVVDNADDPATRDLCRSTATVEYIVETEPGSYAARNSGIRHSSGRILAFTDADCVPSATWLAHGVAALQADSRTGSVAGHVELTAHDAKRPTSVELFELATAMAQKLYVEKWHFGATANMFTRRSTMDEVGLFRGDMKSGGDYEWGRRCYAAGHGVVYAHAATVKHPARRGWGEILRRTRRVAGGVHDLERHRLNVLRMLRRLFNDWPPVDDWVSIWRSPALTSPAQRLRASLVALIAAIVWRVERVRLFLGHETASDVRR